MPSPAFPALADDAVVLRRWRPQDVPAMLRAFDDPVFVEHSDWQPCTAAAARRYLEERDRAFEDGSQLDVAITEPGSVEVVRGGAALNGIDRAQGSASVGYWLAPEARGRGLATRAVRLLSRWAFTDLGLDHLELTCGPDNLGSQRVAERSGFRRVGYLDAHLPFKGGCRDTVVFRLVRTEL